MRVYIIRRLLLMIPTVFIVSLIIFFLVRLIPGDVVDAMLADFGQAVGVTTRPALEKALGLDVPILTQYGHWMESIFLHGDLGNSLWRKTPVVNDILVRWPITLELGLLALIVAQLIALPIGIFSAIRQDTVGDYIARSFAIMCIAVPGFWLGQW